MKKVQKNSCYMNHFDKCVADVMSKGQSLTVKNGMKLESVVSNATNNTKGIKTSGYKIGASGTWVLDEQAQKDAGIFCHYKDGSKMNLDFLKVVNTKNKSEVIIFEQKTSGDIDYTKANGERKRLEEGCEYLRKNYYKDYDVSYRIGCPSGDPSTIGSIAMTFPKDSVLVGDSYYKELGIKDSSGILEEQEHAKAKNTREWLNYAAQNEEFCKAFDKARKALNKN